MRKAASRKSRPRRRGACRGPAFTLIELLVVIAIISLLVGILVPVVSMAVRKAEDARCRARVHELADGCNQYHFEHEYYPGQQYPSQLKGGDALGNVGEYTGSQWLARTLFTDLALGATNPDQVYPQPKYAPVRPAEDLMDPIVDDNLHIVDTDYPFKFATISDRTTRPMPVLYYPSRPGRTGVSIDYDYDGHGAQPKAFNAYKYEDNHDYDYERNKKTSLAFRRFTNFITDGRFDRTPHDVTDDKPYNPGAFLIIAAGMDRIYFTPDDVRYPAWRN